MEIRNRGPPFKPNQRTEVSPLNGSGERAYPALSLLAFAHRASTAFRALSLRSSGVMLWFAYYNFCRVHRTLRVTPAMEAGIANHVWTVGELLNDQQSLQIPGKT